jgi:hypothetical protein
MATTTITFTHETSGGLEITHTLPARFEVCGRCEGHGSHLTPSIGEHAYTREEFDETFHDPDDRAEYFRRGGIYDVECTECHGRRVVPVVHEAEATRTRRGRRVLAIFEALQERHARMLAEERREARYGY